LPTAAECRPPSPHADPVEDSNSLAAPADAAVAGFGDDRVGERMFGALVQRRGSAKTSSSRRPAAATTP